MLCLILKSSTTHSLKQSIRGSRMYGCRVQGLGTPLDFALISSSYTDPPRPLLDTAGRTIGDMHAALREILCSGSDRGPFCTAASPRGIISQGCVCALHSRTAGQAILVLSRPECGSRVQHVPAKLDPCGSCASSSWKMPKASRGCPAMGALEAQL